MLIIKRTQAILEITHLMEKKMQEIERLEQEYIMTVNPWILDALMEEKVKELESLHQQLALFFLPKKDLAQTQAAKLALLMQQIQAL